MSFTSLTFPVFVGVVLFVYSGLPARWRLPFLVVASYVFYSWNHVAFLPLLLASTCIHYIGGRIMAVSTNQGHRRLVATSCVLVDLSLLVLFKYSGVFLGDEARIFSWLYLANPVSKSQLILPPAISFYTLQSIGYTVDVFRRRVPAETSFQRFSLYVAFFPQLVAGPIERAHQFLPQLRDLRRPTASELRGGVALIVWGFFKKLVVADRLAMFCDSVLASPQSYSPAQVLLAPYLFMYRLYCDLSGYTDIAIGVGALFGLRLALNFNLPFTAVSMRSFWQRWHMSLTRWMMEFVYLPLAGALSGRRGRVVGTVVVFMLIGIWHGPSWNYLAFGLMMGLIIVLGDVRRRLMPSPPLLLPQRWRPLWSRLACWNILAVTAVVFAPPNLMTSGRVFARAAATFGGKPGFGALFAGPPLSPYEWLILILGFVVVEVGERLRSGGAFTEAMNAASLPFRWAVAYSVGFAILMFGEFNPLPFYYFRF